jgi:hypothetical protein
MSPNTMNTFKNNLNDEPRYKYRVFPRGNIGLAPISMLLTDGSQLSKIYPRQKGGFVGG